MTPVLDGLRVLDFGRFIAGPFCAALLADLGAEVIRIERPGGGDDRFLMPAFEGREGAMYLHANRGKKAITLDFAKPEGMALARRLIATSDVVVANFSNSALAHFGLDYASLRDIREDIILTSIGAFDSRSALRDAVGFDGVGQAISGAIHLTGEPGRPFRSATSYVDYSTAISAAFATLAAIIRRMKSGEGSHVEATLAGTALNIMNPVLIEQFTGSNVREPVGNRSPIAGPSDVYRASDGWFVMQVIGQSMFRRWTELVDRRELLDDPRFSDDISRGRNGAALSSIMAEWASQRTRAECLASIASANIAASPVLTPADIIGGEMELADTYLQPVDFPGSDGIPIARPPARLVSDEQTAPRRPPLAGEDNEVIYTSLGLGDAEIADLRDKAII